MRNFIFLVFNFEVFNALVFLRNKVNKKIINLNFPSMAVELQTSSLFLVCPKVDSLGGQIANTGC